MGAARVRRGWGMAGYIAALPYLSLTRIPASCCCRGMELEGRKASCSSGARSSHRVHLLLPLQAVPQLSYGLPCPLPARPPTCGLAISSADPAHTHPSFQTPRCFPDPPHAVCVSAPRTLTPRPPTCGLATHVAPPPSTRVSGRGGADGRDVGVYYI